MRVNLAVQVHIKVHSLIMHTQSKLSGFEQLCKFGFEKGEFTETARFCRIFDKFFDCLNTRRIGEGKESRKPDKEPYWSVKDERFTVSFHSWIMLE